MSNSRGVGELRPAAAAGEAHYTDAPGHEPQRIMNETSGASSLSQTAEHARAVGALLLGAALWGCVWYPYRVLHAGGIGGVWALLLSECVATLVCALVFRREIAGISASGSLLIIGLLAGVCNVAFIVGTIHGEVMRVTLLMYLSPLWTVMLSRWLLGERLSRRGALVIGLALAGALVMLWHPAAGAPWPRGLGDWLGLLAGVTFASYNVAVRKACRVSVPLKSFAALAGTLLVAAVLAGFGVEPPPASLTPDSLGWIVGTGVVLFALAPIVQYGLVRLSANRAVVILLSELIFAALSSWWLVGETMGPREWVGGGLIALAALASSRMEA